MNKNRNNIIANYLGQGWSAFMAIAFLPAYIKYLGVEAYGVIGLFTAVQAIVMILDLAIGPTLNREVARLSIGSSKKTDIRNLLYTLEMICFFLGIVGLIVVWLTSHYMSREWLNAENLQADQIAKALFFMWIIACLRLCEGMYRGILFGAGEQVWYNAIFSLAATLRYVGALLILMLISPTLQAFFIWQVVVSLLSLCLLAWRVKYCLPHTQSPKRFSLAILVDVKHFASGMMAIGVVTILLLQLDKIVLSHLVSLKSLGYYTLASTAANAMFMVVVPITQALYPSLVVLSSDPNQEKFIALFRKITQAVVIMVSTATMLLAFFSEGVIYVWSGNHDLVREAALLLTILVIGTFFNCLSYLPYQLQIAFGKTQLLLKIHIFSILIFCPILYTFTYLHGVYGAAWAWLLINLIHLVAILIFTHRALLRSQKWSWYITDVLLPTIAVFSVILVANWFQPIEYSHRLQWLAFLILTGLSSLAVSVFATPLIRKSVIVLIKRK
jgi:O-antigen/teichoic acid export membrane protein